MEIVGGLVILKLNIKSFIGGFDYNISYLVWKEKNKAVVIDSSVNPEMIFSYAKKNNIKILYVIVCHSHFDHKVKLNEYRINDIKLIGHEKLNIDLDMKVKNKDVVELGDMKIEIIHTPGHTMDSISILIDNNLFTSDTLFVGGFGRTDFGGNMEMLRKSIIKKLFTLPEDTKIYPGHDYGYTSTSTIGEEKKNNPIIKEFL